MAQQLGTLNTNSRYLHEGLVQYSEALAATLPPPLEVRHFGRAGLDWRVGGMKGARRDGSNHSGVHST